MGWFRRNLKSRQTVVARWFLYCFASIGKPFLGKFPAYPQCRKRLSPRSAALGVAASDVSHTPFFKVALKRLGVFVVKTSGFGEGKCKPAPLRLLVVFGSLQRNHDVGNIAFRTRPTRAVSRRLSLVVNQNQSHATN